LPIAESHKCIDRFSPAAQLDLKIFLREEDSRTPAYRGKEGKGRAGTGREWREKKGKGTANKGFLRPLREETVA